MYIYAAYLIGFTANLFRYIAYSLDLCFCSILAPENDSDLCFLY
jgi:hypothetical protein